MMIRYEGPYSEVELEGVRCKHGEEVAFPDELAMPALEQDCWTASNVPLPVAVKGKSTTSKRNS